MSRTGWARPRRAARPPTPQREAAEAAERSQTRSHLLRAVAAYTRERSAMAPSRLSCLHARAAGAHRVPFACTTAGLRGGGRHPAQPRPATPCVHDVSRCARVRVYVQEHTPTVWRHPPRQPHGQRWPRRRRTAKRPRAAAPAETTNTRGTPPLSTTRDAPPVHAACHGWRVKPGLAV
jgi:hypothetical protein